MDTLSNFDLHLMLGRFNVFKLLNVTTAVLARFVPLLIIAYVTSCLYSIYLHPLRNIPGPFVAKFSEAWRTSKYIQGDWHQEVLDLHRRYGPVVRLSPNEVSIVDKAGLVEVYSHGKGTRKTSWYDIWKAFSEDNSNSFFNATDPAEHSFLRRRVATAYSLSNLLPMEPEIEKLANGLWAQLDRLALAGQPANLHHWTSYFAFDVVGRLGIGKPIGFLKEGKDVHGIIEAICDGFWLVSNAGYIPGAFFCFRNPIIQALMKLLTHDGNGSTNSNNFAKWNYEQVVERMKEPAGVDRKSDLLDTFIAMKEPDGSKATVGSVLVETGNLIGAGADTTSIGIRSVLACLISHPDDYEQVREEVDAAYAAHPEINRDQVLPYRILETLPHLSACIKEALRLHPSILWQLPREAPSAGVNIAGYYIPAGATISMSPKAQNRDQSVFGPDADRWNPNRWKVGDGNSEAKIREMDKFNVTFGYGSRSCVGRNLAILEINKTVSEFCRRYKAVWANPERPYKLVSQWFSYQADMNVYLTLRETSNQLPVLQL